MAHVKCQGTFRPQKYPKMPANRSKPFNQHFQVHLGKIDHKLGHFLIYYEHFLVSHLLETNFHEIPEFNKICVHTTELSYCFKKYQLDLQHLSENTCVSPRTKLETVQLLNIYKNRYFLNLQTVKENTSFYSFSIFKC